MTSRSREITIHVGIQKTGSTFLQNSIFPNMSNGTYVRNGPLKFFLEDLAFNEGPFLISCENFTARSMIEGGRTELTKRLYKTLSDMFPKCKLIIILREPSSLLESSFKQNVFQGGVCTFDEFANHYWKKLDYLDLLDSISEMNFGSILLIDYDQLKNDPFWVVSSIENFVGGGVKFDYAENALRKREHKSLDRNALRLLLFFNRWVYGESHPKMWNPKNPRPSKICKLLLHSKLHPRGVLGKWPFSKLSYRGKECVNDETRQWYKRAYQAEWRKARERIIENQRVSLGGEG